MLLWGTTILDTPHIQRLIWRIRGALHLSQIYLKSCSPGVCDWTTRQASVSSVSSVHQPGPLLYHIIHTIHIASYHHCKAKRPKSWTISRSHGGSVGRQGHEDWYVHSVTAKVGLPSHRSRQDLLTDIMRETSCRGREMCTSLEASGRDSSVFLMSAMEGAGGSCRDLFFHRLPGVCIWSHWFRQRDNKATKSTYHLHRNRRRLSRTTVATSLQAGSIVC